MWKRFARKPSTASLIPATRNSAKATSISPDMIAQITAGTRMMRPKVMRFGMLKAAPGSGADLPRAVLSALYSGAPVLAHPAIPT